jgi:hypothetical protein
VRSEFFYRKRIREKKGEGRQIRMIFFGEDPLRVAVGDERRATSKEGESGKGGASIWWGMERRVKSHRFFARREYSIVTHSLCVF